MALKFIIKLALKNLRFRFLRTLLTLSGIVIGISAIIFLAAFTFGLENLVTRSLGGGEAFMFLDVGTGSSQIIKINDETVGKIASLKDVTSVEKSVSVPAKLSFGGTTTADISFYGTSSEYLNMSGAKLEYGKMISSSELSEILVNTATLKIIGGYKENIGKKVKFELVIPKELTDSEKELAVKDQEFTIVGFIADESTPKIYANAKSLTATGLKNYSQLKVKVKDKASVNYVRKTIENMGLKTQYVGDTVAEIESVFGIFRLILISFGLLALVVAVLGMFNTLTISLMERIREVALLKVFGITQKNLRRIFLVEASLYGILGGILGILAGVMLGTIANSIVNHYALQAGGEAVALFHYPIIFVIFVFICSFLVGFLTGLYPARKAAKVDVLDVLRYE